MPYLRHYGVFVPKIGDFSGKVNTKSKRDGLSINHFPLVVFLEKSLSVSKEVPGTTYLLYTLSIPLA